MLITYLVSAILLLVAAFIVFRIIVRRDYLQRGRLTLPSTMLESIIWLPYFSFPHIYNTPSWAAFWLPDQTVHRSFLRYIGTILIVAGFVLGLLAMAALGFRRAFGQEVNVLKQTGLYALTRNPQTVLFSPLIAGVALRWPSWYALGWVILFAAIYVVLSMLIVHELRKRNVKISFFLLRLFLLKYANQYKEMAQRETGKVGTLYYGWLVSINAALVFAIIALVLR